MWPGPLDPLIHHGEDAFRARRTVIDPCRPYERLKDFPKVARANPEMLAKVKKKFAVLLAKA